MASPTNWVFLQSRSRTSQNIVTYHLRIKIQRHLKLCPEMWLTLSKLLRKLSIEVCSKMSDWEKYLSQCRILEKSIFQSCFFRLRPFAAYERFAHNKCSLQKICTINNVKMKRYLPHSFQVPVSFKVLMSNTRPFRTQLLNFEAVYEQLALFRTQKTCLSNVSKETVFDRLH